MKANMDERKRMDTAAVSARLGRHPVTLDRWVRLGHLAPPHKLLGRKFWWQDEVEEAERKLADPANAPTKLTAEEMAKIAAKGRAARAGGK